MGRLNTSCYKLTIQVNIQYKKKGEKSSTELENKLTKSIQGGKYNFPGKKTEEFLAYFGVDN